MLRLPKLLAHYAAKAERKLSLGLLRSVADYADLAAIEEAAREARMHGFDGATCVHPAIVPILNAAFAPTPDEIAWAGRVVAAAQTQSGAFSVDGRMVDAPVIARARSILAESIMRKDGPAGLPRRLAALYPGWLPGLAPRRDPMWWWFDRMALARMARAAVS